MDADTAAATFVPLDLEQALHFLDVMTWFPATDAGRFEKYRDYVDARCPDSTAHPPVVYAKVLERFSDSLGDLGSALTNGGERTPALRKRLYELKYDLKTVLFPDDWFTFMNMGYADGDEGELARQLSGSESFWLYSARLYDVVAAGTKLGRRDVVEVGSGRGGGAALLARLHSPRSYVGIDYSPGNVAFCKRVHRVPGLSFKVGDAERLPLPDASVDAVVNIESAHCYPEPERFLAEVRRVLRSGGRLLFADEWWRTEIDRLDELLAGSGLRIVGDQEITENIIRALDELEARYPAWVAAIDDEAQRRVWDRFFRVRVCDDSRASYTGGRFLFRRVTLEKD